VANSLKQEGAGFQSDTNVVTIITETEIKPLKQMSKDQVAKAVLDEILEKRKEKRES
ncbi:MAG: phosphopantothenoylcysteine decarboxylase, partial [Clostridium sp.]